MKNKKIALFAVVFILLIVFLCIYFINETKKDNKNDNEQKQTTHISEITRDISEEESSSTTKNHEAESITEKNTDIEFETETATVLIHEDLKNPGEGTLDIGKIAGFIQENKYNTDTDENDGTTENDGIALSVNNITAEAVGSYTGNYVEDGSDEPIQNVASLIVTNHSEAMLQVADIEFKVNDSETARFRVTNLLPGTAVLVLEANKREYNSMDDYSYGTVATAWIDYVSLHEDKFLITKDDGKLTLKNKTENTYTKVYVYYKYAQVGGAYMGGITYRVPFENIAPNATIESVANHFNKATSRIIDVQIVE